MFQLDLPGNLATRDDDIPKASNLGETWVRGTQRGFFFLLSERQRPDHQTPDHQRRTSTPQKANQRKEQTKAPIQGQATSKQGHASQSSQKHHGQTRPTTKNIPRRAPNRKYDPGILFPSKITELNQRERTEDASANLEDNCGVTSEIFKRSLG
jgi:hypothetical protein